MISGLANSAKSYNFTEHRFIVILFLIVKFIYSIEKNGILKREKSHWKCFANFKKIYI